MSYNICNKKKSVFFISLHKCATSYFGRKVFPKITDLINVNYESIHYINREVNIDINKYGFLYGPLKIPDDEHPSAKYINSIIDPDFLFNKKVIIMVRDPRDLIVSMYYSFGFSHPFSPNPEIKLFQEKRKKIIQSLTIDQYAQETAENLNKKFDRLRIIIEKNKNCILLQYNDMLKNYEKFINDLNIYIPVTKKLKEQIFKDTRPKDKEDINSHKRHGISGGYLKKLTANTIEYLNSIFKSNLDFFGYR